MITFFFKKPSDILCAATARIFPLLWSCNYTRACREPRAAPVLLHVLSAGAVPPAGPVQHLRATSGSRLLYRQTWAGARAQQHEAPCFNLLY